MCDRGHSCDVSPSPNLILGTLIIKCYPLVSVGLLVCEGEISVGGVLHTHPGVHRSFPLQSNRAVLLYLFVVLCILQLLLILYSLKGFIAVHCLLDTTIFFFAQTCYFNSLTLTNTTKDMPLCFHVQADKRKLMKESG